LPYEALKAEAVPRRIRLLEELLELVSVFEREVG
jgi:hypothetical protein